MVVIWTDWFWYLIVGMEVLTVILLCVLITRKGRRDPSDPTKDREQDEGAEDVSPELHQSWLSIIQASKEYGLDRSWIYRRVKKGVIPKRIENGRMVVLEAWFKLRFDPELSKITTDYLKQSFISQRITSKEYGDGKTTRLQRIESNTDAR